MHGDYKYILNFVNHVLGLPQLHLSVTLLGIRTGKKEDDKEERIK